MMIHDAVRRYLQKQQQEKISLKAVLFDMDGVLFDSMPFHARAWQETAEKHHLIACPEDFFLFEGRTGGSTIDALFQRTFRRNATEEEKDSIYKEKAELFNRYNDGNVMEGAKEVLMQVKAYGLQPVIVTGSGQYSLIDKLEKAYPGVFEKDKMVTAYDVEYGKPHPEPYLLGLDKVGVKANEAIIIENAPMGVEAGVAADILTLAVNTGPLADDVLVKAGADLLYPDMKSLANDWKGLMAAISETKR